MSLSHTFFNGLNRVLDHSIIRSEKYVTKHVVLVEETEAMRNVM